MTQSLGGDNYDDDGRSLLVLTDWERFGTVPVTWESSEKSDYFKTHTHISYCIIIVWKQFYLHW